MAKDRRSIDPTIGRRVRAARIWRGWDQQVLAARAGFTKGYLSKIENGLSPVDKRATLEKLARVLEVSPSDLTGSTGSFLAQAGSDEERDALVPLRLALADIEFGEEIDTPPAPWPQIEQRLSAMNALRPKADYAARNAMLPSLIRDLHASLDGPNRYEALVGLTDCYTAAETAAKNLGAVDLAQVAARHLRDVTSHLDGPEWEGLAAWGRVNAISGSARQRAYLVATKAATALDDHLDRPEIAELYGMLHLSAALGSTVAGAYDQASTHLREAETIAGRPGVGSANFGYLSFGPGNVAIWRTMLAVEAGEGGRAIEIARQVDPTTLPASPSRRASFHIDRGRAAAMVRRDEEAVQAFRVAKQLAPQRAHGDPWIRETVTTMRERARRDAVRRDLNGLAYWLGIGRTA
jgi:transcriptional regulator with XRE-family HTH domain